MKDLPFRSEEDLTSMLTQLRRTPSMIQNNHSKESQATTDSLSIKEVTHRLATRSKNRSLGSL